MLFIKGNVFVPHGCRLYTESKAIRLNVLQTFLKLFLGIPEKFRK